MNVDDLLKELNRIGINTNACLVLPVHRVEGALCLTREDDGQWLVSSVERGESVIENRFPTQEAACSFFLKYVISDPTYFKDFYMEKYELLKKRSAKLLEDFGFQQTS